MQSTNPSLRRILTLGLPLLLFCAPLPIFAQEPTAVSISANSMPSFANRPPVAQLTRQEIEQSGAASLTDLLNRLLPVYVDAGPSGSSIYLRGAESNYTLVLIDGVPLNDPTDARGGAVDLERISLGEVERIEILSAGSAAMVAQGALAGAINIITRKFRDQQSNVQAGVGRQGVALGGARLNSFTESKALSVAVFGSEDEELLEQNERSRRGADVRGEFLLAPGLISKFGVRAGQLSQWAFPEDSGGPEYALLQDRSQRNQDEVLAQGELRGRVSDDAHFLIQYAHLFLDTQEDSAAVLPGLRDPFGIPAIDAKSSLHRDTLLWRYERQISASLLWQAGLDAAQERSSSTSSIFFGDEAVPADFELDRHSLGALSALRYLWSEEGSAKFGLRYDYYEGFEGEFEPIVELEQQVTARLATWIGYSTSSKAPSVYALSHPFVGNPSLKRERSTTVDGGVRGDFLGGSMRLGLFYASYRDPIDLDEGPPPRLVNREEIESYGSELAFSRTVTDAVTTALFVSYQHSAILASDEELRNRPEWRAGGTLSFRPGERTEVGGTLRFIGSRNDSSVPTGDRTLQGYMQSDLFAGLRLSSAVTLRLSVENVFNDRREEQIGVRSVGIIPRLLLEARI